MMADTEVDSGVVKLREELAAKDRDLKMAAEIGKQLLEENNTLHGQLEQAMKERSSIVEGLEQEKYSFQLKLEQQAKMETHYAEEVESLKVAIQKQKAEYEEFRNTEHDNKVTELKNQLRNQQTDLEQSQLLCRQLEASKEQLEGTLQEARAQLEQRINTLNETCSDELAQLHMDINSLQNEKISLEKDLNEARHLVERHEHSLQMALSRAAATEQEVEERQAQATSYYNALEKAREEVQDLKVELDVLRMETQNKNAKGNSLFGELEDRRVQAEKELISVKVQLDTLQKQYKITRQHEHTLKLQLSVLLQKAGHTADVQHMERLQQLLGQAQGEINELNQKLHAVENQPQAKNPKAELYDAWSKDIYKNDPTRMQFFEKVLEAKEKEIESLESQLKTKRMMLLAEDQKVLKYEGRLYDTERQLERERDANIKLRLRVDELRMKYEPDRKLPGATGKGKTEKIPVAKKPSGKENEKVMIRDALAKNKPAKDTTKPKPHTSPKDNNNDAFSSEAPKPILRAKSLQKKQVRLSEDIDIIEPLSPTDDNSDCKQNNSPQGSTSDKGQGHTDQGQGRVRGRERYNKVNMVKTEGDEDVNCPQQ